jgi:hypothetical protein
LERVVHSFDWLADLDASAPREEAAPVAERIMAAWLKANPKPPSRPGKGAAWTVGNTGARLMNWLVHAPLILSGVDRERCVRACSMRLPIPRAGSIAMSRGRKTGLPKVAAGARSLPPACCCPMAGARAAFWRGRPDAALGEALGR